MNVPALDRAAFPATCSRTTPVNGSSRLSRQRAAPVLLRPLDDFERSRAARDRGAASLRLCPAPRSSSEWLPAGRLRGYRPTQHEQPLGPAMIQFRSMPRRLPGDGASRVRTSGGRSSPRPSLTLAHGCGAVPAAGPRTGDL